MTNMEEVITPYLYKAGDIIEGTIIQVKDYGAFMIFNHDVRGLLHISEITNQFVRNIHRMLKIGMIRRVKVCEVDEKTGFIKVSIKKLTEEDNQLNIEDGKYREEVDFSEVDFSPLEKYTKD